MGGGSSVPANTTSTTTVNQSPWQNPTYQALMLGDASNPGPVTSMLRASNALMQQYNTINQRGLSPAAQASLGTWNPTTSTTANYVNMLDPATGQYVPIPNANLPGAQQPNTPAALAPQPAQPAQSAPQQAAVGGIMSLSPNEYRR